MSLACRWLALVFCLLAVCAQAAPQQVSERQLAEVRAKIAKLTAGVAKRTQQRDALTAALSRSEKEIASAHTRRRGIKLQQSQARQRLRAIDEERKLQQASLLRETNELARQLRAAYQAGKQERIKMILNQQNPEELGRMLVYYRYLNNARLANLGSLRDGLANLLSLRARAQSENDELEALERAATATLKRLTDAQSERRDLLVKIEKQLQDEGKMLVSLQSQEAELADLLEELSGILADYPISSEAPFSQLRGELSWPVAGQLISDFGEPRAGGRVRSKGIIIGSDAGNEVRAIYHGRVAFSDWLPGLGLLVIVDHGEGLLSLYGYNETLSKSVGDWISPGDVIATVGNSGGQSRPALYFELRKGRNAVNPRPWFKSRPGVVR